MACLGEGENALYASMVGQNLGQMGNKMMNSALLAPVGERRVPLKVPVVLGLLLIASVAWAKPFPFHIQIEAWSPYFLPKAAFVEAGTPVRWENPTATHHTITHDGCVNGGPCAFDSGVIPPSGVYDLAGLAPGRYAYHCTLHPIMRGVLVVTENLRASRT